MPDAAACPARLRIQYGHHVASGFALMDYDRQPLVCRQRQLALKSRALDVARRVIVIIIQPDFADGYHFRAGSQCGQLDQRRVIQQPALMRMHTDRRAQLRILARQRDGLPAGGHIITDHQCAGHAGGMHPRQQGFHLRQQAWIVEMAMGIDHAVGLVVSGVGGGGSKRVSRASNPSCSSGVVR